jgi:hypothetical protein
MTIGSVKENLTMRKMLLRTATSILAASRVTGASAQNIDWQIFTEPFVTSAQAQEIDWQKVDDALGRKPAISGDVRRYGFPRSDLTVTLDGVTIKPARALGGRIAFKPMGGEAMVMGDLVLLESEINPMMLKMAFASGRSPAKSRRKAFSERRPSSPSNSIPAVAGGAGYVFARAV